MNIKKWMALVLAVLLLVLVACGGADSSAASVLPASLPAPASQPASSAGVASAAGQPALPQFGPLQYTPGVNVLTGLPRAGDLPAGQRPLAIVVSNSARARPQRGLAAADVVVEMLAKGAVTHLLALYDDMRLLNTTGPVNKTYDQLVQFALPLNAVQVHAGASQYARNLLGITGMATVDGLSLGRLAFGFDFIRTTPRPGGKLNEFCWFTDSPLIAAGMAQVGVAGEGELSPLFRFGQSQHAGEAAAFVTARYAEQVTADFSYDAASGLYVKYADGALHTDEDGTQLAYTNLLLLNTTVTTKADADPYDPHWEFDLGGGNGWYFTAGRMQPVTWVKGGPTDALRLADEAGQELVVNIGKSYVGFVPAFLEGNVTWRAPEAA